VKIEFYLFAFIAAFLSLIGAIYIIIAGDPSGGVPLWFAAALGMIIGYYFWYTSRRIPPRPEDRADADIDEGSGEIGFFSPHSWWPLWLAVGAALAFLGVIFGMWLVLIGVGAGFIALTGFILEYYLKGDA
jgi:Cytochrome c oxidase subunit IV